MLRSATSALAALALIASLAFSGCGGSSPPGHAAAGSSSAPAASTAAAPAAAAPTQKQAPGGTTPSSDPSSVPSRCIASAGADPAAFTICLANHGVHLSNGGKLVGCVQSAPNKAALEQCLAEAAR